MTTDTMLCPKCNSVISFKKDEPPRRCVCCKTQFVKEEEVAVISSSGKTPTVVKIEPINVKGKSKEVK